MVSTPTPNSSIILRKISGRTTAWAWLIAWATEQAERPHRPDIADLGSRVLGAGMLDAGALDTRLEGGGGRHGHDAYRAPTPLGQQPGPGAGGFHADRSRRCMAEWPSAHRRPALPGPYGRLYVGIRRW